MAAEILDLDLGPFVCMYMSLIIYITTFVVLSRELDKPKI